MTHKLNVDSQKYTFLNWPSRI